MPDRQQIAADYQASPGFTADAVQWFADLDAADQPDYLTGEIARHYVRSTAYATVIDDAIDDADELETRRQSRINHPSNRNQS